MKNNIATRTFNLKTKLLSAPAEICIERAMLWTEAYFKNKKDSVVIRNAKALKNVLENITVNIYDDELIVGNRTSNFKGAPLFPEIKSSWIEAEIDILSERAVQPFYISDGDKKKLKNILPLWRGKTVWDRAMDLMPASLQKEVFKLIFTISAEFANGIGHFLPGHNKVVEIGLCGIKNSAEKKLKSLSGNSKEKKDFLKAIIITIDAVSNFINRFSLLAQDLAKKENNKQRKNELLKISKVCKNISLHPPTNFHEALQLVWFMQLIIQIEDGGFAISLGRLDQILYPFYKNDIAKKQITGEFARELIEQFYLKIDSVVNVLETMNVSVASGPPVTQNLTIGGIDKNGKDAVNELSFLFLEGYKNVKTSQPNFSIRVSKFTKDDFLIKVAEAVKEGTTLQYFNDEIIIPAIISRGVADADARNYAIVGCVEPSIPGKTFGSTDSNLFNIAKCLELALYNGNGVNFLNEALLISKKFSVYLKNKNKSNLNNYFSISKWILNTLRFSKNVKINALDLMKIFSGKKIGLKTGEAVNFKSFNDLIPAYKKQVEYFVEKMVSAMYYCDKAHSQLKPVPFISSTIDNCISQAKDLTSGGAKYNFTGPQAIGVADTGDTLYAIKKFVFDEKIITMQKLLKVLSANFKDNEKLRFMFLNKAQKYGNDVDEVDKITAKAIEIYCQAVAKHKNFRDGYFNPGAYSMSGYIVFGILTGASANGRKFGDALTEGVSPSHGKELKGPTAVMKSCAKLSHKLISNGSVLNMKFHPASLNGENNLKKFNDLLKTYFQLNGSQVQFNVVSRETLLSAQKNPEKYKGLVVRVAGYSAYFTELDEATQKDIIERTEL